MKSDIAKAGNLFYQYRACRRDAETIYDIENIRHGVVYARTPLQMNDPFDSMVGFSVEEIYNECIDLVLEQVESTLDPNLKFVIKCLLQQRLLGQTLGFVSALNNLKKYIFRESLISHKSVSQLPEFIVRNQKNLYKKCPADVKKYFNKDAFLIFALIVKDYQNVDIEEKTIIDVFKMEELLKELEIKATEAKEQIFIPFLKDFLSKLTVSCFSASGWDNQLMWSHYANSYSGICVEYDFEKMQDFIGFMFPVKYSDVRPTISLKDLGVTSLKKDDNGNIITNEVDIKSIFYYLLSKNKCWSYEEEWRIINNGEEPYTPLFINAPFVKSITLGFELEDICRQLLWDICQELNIDCYQLIINSSDYTLKREILTAASFTFDKDKEEQYFNLISKHTIPLGEKIAKNSNILTAAIQEGRFEVDALFSVLACTLDYLSDVYFMKISFNRYCRYTNSSISDITNEKSLCKAILQIDEFIYQAEMGAKIIEESLLGVRVMNKISSFEYKNAMKLIADIKELFEKHQEMQWFGREAIETVKEKILAEIDNEE
jgi:hypothetical protein